MEFTLHYQGPLKSGARPAEKHALRRHFHTQLAKLWSQKPLAGCFGPLEPEGGPMSLIRKLQGFTFAPLVSERIASVAELDVTLLRPEPPGAIIGQGGDIDNRLKTLFDALKAPSEPSELPIDATPGDGETPFFYCLLDDDRLITRVSISTAQLLEHVQCHTEVVLFIRVVTKFLERRLGTIGL